MSQIKAFLHLLTTDGQWVPVRGDKTGGTARRSNTAWTYVAAAGGVTDTADVTLKAAPGVGNSVYITGLQICNKHAATGTEVVLKSNSSVLWRGYAAPAGVINNVSFSDPLCADNNTDLTAACVTTGTATLINAQGYTDLSYVQLQALVSGPEEIFDDNGDLLLSDSGATLTT